MNKWKTPAPVSETDLAFGRRVFELLPAPEDTPIQFYNGHDPYRAFVSSWFMSGCDTARLVEKPGIDRAAALRHVTACISSFAPKHEHRIAGCAYLLSLWFTLKEG